MVSGYWLVKQVSYIRAVTLSSSDRISSLEEISIRIKPYSKIQALSSFVGSLPCQKIPIALT
jgi:hypothetical protein